MAVTKKKSNRKAAPAAKKAASAHQQRSRIKRTGKGGRGVSRAVALHSMARFGSPLDRLRARVQEEAQRADVTLLRSDEKLFSVKEAAERCGVSAYTLRRWALMDKVVYRRLGGVLMRIPESEIERLRSYGN